MGRPNTAALAVAAVMAIAVMGGLGLARGGLYMDRYEGDVLHLAEIVMRLVQGQRPHVDFMTPIGPLAAWPIAVFVKAGLGIGMAVHAAQISVALIVALPAVWAGRTRFTPGLAYLFVLLCIVLVMALVHGEADPNISMSMHYNRWAWAFSFVALALAILPARGPGSWKIDGAIIGFALSVILLIKVTYVIALAPAIVAALWLRGSRNTLLAAFIAGVVLLGAATVVVGPAFWPAYVADLLATAKSDTRAYPGLPLDQVLTAPTFLGGHILFLVGIVLLRQGGRRSDGLCLLVLFPGVIYITFQNFGNDPQWLALTAMIAMMLRPDVSRTNVFGWPLNSGTTLVAACMAAMIAPSYLNMAYSPFRHFTDDRDQFVRIFPNSSRHDDFFTLAARANQVDMQVPGEKRMAPLEDAGLFADRDPPSILNDEELADCGIKSGLVAWLQATAADLEKTGYARGKQILTADLLSNLPLFSDQIEWVMGGAPWRYDGVPGLESADYVLVPTCPVDERSRREILQAIRTSHVTLREVSRTPLFILMEKL